MRERDLPGMEGVEERREQNRRNRVAQAEAELEGLMLGILGLDKKRSVPGYSAAALHRLRRAIDKVLEERLP